MPERAMPSHTRETKWHRDDFSQLIVHLFGDGRKTFRIAAPVGGNDRFFVPPDHIPKRFVDVEMRRGDVLFLPALWAHKVVTRGPCCTINFGFPACTSVM